MEKEKKTTAKLEDLVDAFHHQCQAVLNKLIKDMMEADSKMVEYQEKVEQLKTEIVEEITKTDNEMQQVKQALTDLCQSI